MNLRKAVEADRPFLESLIPYSKDVDRFFLHNGYIGSVDGQDIQAMCYAENGRGVFVYYLANLSPDIKNIFFWIDRFFETHDYIEFCQVNDDWRLFFDRYFPNDPDRGDESYLVFRKEYYGKL